MCYSGESANGFIATLEAEVRPGKFRAFNIASGELISLREMIAVLQALYPAWVCVAGPGLNYRRGHMGDYFLMETKKAREELGFKPAFDFRRAVIDYAETLARLGNGLPR